MTKEVISRVEKLAEVCTIWASSAAIQMEKIVTECRFSDVEINKISGTNQSIPIKAGFGAERLHTETFNLDSILKNKEVKAYTDSCSGSPLPRNHPTHDIVVMNGEEQVLGVQLKYFKDGEKTANAFRDTRDGVAYYKDSDALIGPADQLADIQAKARQVELKNQETRPDVASAARDVQEKATDRLKYGDVESRPLSKNEAEIIAKGDEAGKGAHRKIQNQYKNQSTLQQSLNAGKSAAIITSVISGTINTISCLNMVQNGKMTTDEAVIYILKNTGIAAADAALKATAATAAVSLIAREIPELFKGSMLQSNLVSGAAGGVAICAVDLVECLVLVAVGRMTIAELETRTGKNIFQTGSGVIGASIGAVIGASAGPVGALLGSLIGGMITSVATTVAIENNIEKPFREIMNNTAQIVVTEHIMINSIQYLDQAQTVFSDFRIGCYVSEQQFDKKIDRVNQLGLSMQQKLNSI